ARLDASEGGWADLERTRPRQLRPREASGGDGCKKAPALASRHRLRSLVNIGLRAAGSQRARCAHAAPPLLAPEHWPKPNIARPPPAPPPPRPGTWAKAEHPPPQALQRSGCAPIQSRNLRAE